MTGHHELQERCLDFVRVGAGPSAAVAVGAPRPELDVAALDLVEHGIGKVLVKRDRLLLGVVGVVDLNGLLDRLEGRFAGEVLEVQVVVVDVADPPAEQIAEPAVGVLANGDQEVGRHRRRVHTLRELVRQAVGATGG